MYDLTNKIWHCCGGDQKGDPHCNKPTIDNFDAPAPSLLKTLYQAGVGPVPTTTSSTSKKPTSTSSTTTPTTGLVIVTDTPPTPTPTQTAGSKLSAGAAAGIGAGVAVGAVFAIVAALFWIWKRRKGRKAQQGGEVGAGTSYAPVAPGTPPEYRRSIVKDVKSDIPLPVAVPAMQSERPAELGLNSPIEMAAVRKPPDSRPPPPAVVPELPGDDVQPRGRT